VTRYALTSANDARGTPGLTAGISGRTVLDHLDRRLTTFRNAS
jgi:hypothetical protein